MDLGELEILNLHASGGMAEVYRARVTGDDGQVREYAVKKILPQFTRDKEILRMFVEEARVAAYLQHDCVVRVHDLCTSDAGEYYIVMEFADGKDLSDVIWEASQKQQTIPVGMTLQAARDVLKALDYAWNAVDEQGRQLKLIHRDISPHNVLVTWDGRIKLTDFGIAKVAASANKTQMGIIKGKFGYMSPEQARGKPLDQRSDLFNVGILLYEGFTGERLFDGQNDIETLEAMRAAKIPRLPPELGIAVDIEAVMRRALEKDPDKRFATAREFEAALLAAVQRSGVVIRPAECAATMKRLFPQLVQEPVVRGTRQLDLKSQLWQGPAVQAGGRAAALPDLGPSSSSTSSSSRAKAAPLVSGGKAAQPLEASGSSARPAIKVGGGARSLDDEPRRPPAPPPPPPPAARPPPPPPQATTSGPPAVRPAAPPPPPPPAAPPPPPPSVASPPAGLAPMPMPAPPPQMALAPTPMPPPPPPPAAPLAPTPMPPPPPAAPQYQPAPSPPPFQPAPSAPPAAYQPAPSPPPPYQPAPSPPYQPAPSPPYQPAPSPPYQPAPSPPYQPAPSPPPPPPTAWQPAPSPPPPPSPPPAPPWQASPPPPPAPPAWQPTPPPPPPASWQPPVPAPPPPGPPAQAGPPPPPAALAAPRTAPPPPGLAPPPPPPAGLSPAPPSPAGPVGAESGLSLPLGGSIAGAAGAAAATPVAPVRRRPRWQVQLEVFLETWLPLRARVVGVILAVLGAGAGGAVVLGARALVAREPRDARTLVVRSSPPGASVTLDDKRLVGVTPLIVDTRLADGTHQVKLTLAAGPPALRKIELADGDRSVTVRENLQSAGRVRVETRPAGAQVTLDKRHVGRSPVVLDDVPLDKPHAVEVEARSYKKASAPVPVERGGEHVIRLVLEPQGSPPRLVVTTSVPAELEIDGQPHGATGATEHPSIPGPHEVIVRVPSLGIEHRATVDVPASGVLKVFVPVDGYSLPKS